MNHSRRGLSLRARLLKRGFDLVSSAAGLAVSTPVIMLAFVAASIDTRRNGFFLQRRIGRHGKVFRIIKIRTMREMADVTTAVTTAHDPRITRLGRLLRRTKIDELPQLLNVLVGQMSFVGPRPDVPGFADLLSGDDRIILCLRPGITGPASLEFRNEEALLAEQADPETYNRDVLFPAKVRLNREYVENYTFWGDMRYIWETIFGVSTFPRNAAREGRYGDVSA